MPRKPCCHSVPTLEGSNPYGGWKPWLNVRASFVLHAAVTTMSSTTHGAVDKTCGHVGDVHSPALQLPVILYFTTNPPDMRTPASASALATVPRPLPCFQPTRLSTP